MTEGRNGTADDRDTNPSLRPMRETELVEMDDPAEQALAIPLHHPLAEIRLADPSVWGTSEFRGGSCTRSLSRTSKRTAKGADCLTSVLKRSVLSILRLPDTALPTMKRDLRLDRLLFPRVDWPKLPVEHRRITHHYHSHDGDVSQSVNTAV